MVKVVLDQESHCLRVSMTVEEERQFKADADKLGVSASVSGRPRGEAVSRYCQAAPRATKIGWQLRCGDGSRDFLGTATDTLCGICVVISW